MDFMISSSHGWISGALLLIGGLGVFEVGGMVFCRCVMKDIDL